MKMHILTKELSAHKFDAWETTPRTALEQLVAISSSLKENYFRMCGLSQYASVNSPAVLREAVKSITGLFGELRTIVRAFEAFLPNFLEAAEVGANKVELAKITEELSNLEAQKMELDQRQAELAARSANMGTLGPYR